MKPKSSMLAAWVLALLATHPAAALEGNSKQVEEPIPPAPASPEEPHRQPSLWGETLGRDELIRSVLESNPEIPGARSAWRAALERVPQAGSLADPTVSYSVAPLSVGSSDVRFGDVLRVGQPIPFPGKLDLREEVAAAEASAAENEIADVRLKLATMAALLWDGYWLVERALEINEEHLALLDSFQQVATSRYAAGLVAQQAPLQAEVEAAHLLHQEVVLETRRRVLTSQINALLHRGPRKPLPPPAPELAGDEGRSRGAPRDLAALEARVLEAQALASRPELLAQAAEVEAREAGVELAKLAGKPDFEVMTSYNSMWSMPDHRWMVGVGVRLPIWRKRIRAGIAEAEAELDATRSALDRKNDEVREQVAVAHERLQEAHHVVELYENRVLPAARDQVQAARSGFETGGNTMLSLIDAERSLRTAELNYYQALADASTRRAELDRALGRLPFAAARAEATPRTASPRTGSPRTNSQETETN